MYVLPPALEAALAGLPTAVARLVCLWPDGSVRRTFEGAMVGGTVDADRARDVRRTAAVELSNPDGEVTPTVPGDLFAEGSWVRVERGAIVDGGALTAPLFTGVVASFRASMSGRLSLSCEDPLSLVDQTLGEQADIDEGMPAGVAIRRLWDPALPGATWDIRDDARVVGSPLSWPASENRLAVGLELLASMGLEAYADRLGRIVVRPLVDPTTAPTVATWAQGVDSRILDLERTGSTRPVNMVRVIAEPPDGEPLLGVAEVEAWDSPIHRDRIGLRVHELRSAALRTQSDAEATARALLGHLALQQDTLAQSVVPDIALAVDEGDVCEWQPEARSGVAGRYRIDRVSVGIVSGAVTITASRVVPLFAEVAGV